MGYFAKNLRFLRLSRKLSQESLAKALELNRGNIASYEKGTAEPNLNNLLKISKYFNTDISQLVEIDLEVLLKPFENLHENTTMKQLLSDEIKLQENLVERKKQIERLKIRSDNMGKIIEGFRQFYKFKLESAKEISDDARKMAMDYDRLFDVLDEVLKSNRSLIRLIEEKDSF